MPTACTACAATSLQSRITIVDGATVAPRHLNSHVDYGRVPGSEDEIERSVAFPDRHGVLSIRRCDGLQWRHSAPEPRRGARRDSSRAASSRPRRSRSAAAHGRRARRDARPALRDEPLRARRHVTSRSATATRARRRPLDIAALRSDAARDPPGSGASSTTPHLSAACIPATPSAISTRSPGTPATPAPASQPCLKSFRRGAGTCVHHQGPMTTQSLRGMAERLVRCAWRGDRTGGAARTPARRGQRSRRSIRRSSGCSEPRQPARGGRDAGVHRLSLTSLSAESGARLDKLADHRATAGHQIFTTSATPMAAGCCNVWRPRWGFGSDGFATTRTRPVVQDRPPAQRCLRRSACSACRALQNCPASQTGNNADLGPRLRGFLRRQRRVSSLDAAVVQPIRCSRKTQHPNISSFLLAFDTEQFPGRRTTQVIARRRTRTRTVGRVSTC